MGELTHLSLFSGIGGLDLAAEWAGIKTVGQCEWADYPTKVLEKHWPDVQRWKDIRTLTKESFYERTGLRTVDVVSGGFPCQPFSVAGKQRGKEDDRYLWPEMARVVEELRPAWVIGENVAGIIKLALDDVLFDLESKGYATRTFLIPASGVNARHQRYRTAIVACYEGNGKMRREGAVDVENADSGGCRKQGNVCEQPGRTEFKWTGEIMADTERKYTRGLPGRKEKEESRSGSSGTYVQYTNETGCKEFDFSAEPDKKKFSGGGCNEGNVCDSAVDGLEDGRGKRGSDKKGGKEGDEQWQRRPAESILGGMAYGFPDRVDGYWDIEPDIPRIEKGIANRRERLQCLGNAVVPQQFYPIFQAIVECERNGEY